MSHIKKIILFLIISLPVCTFSNIAIADEKVATLKEGDTAPFDGTIFNTEAAARLIIDLESSQKSCDLKVDEEVEKTKARCQLDIDIMKATRDALQIKYDEIMFRFKFIYT